MLLLFRPRSAAGAGFDTAAPPFISSVINALPGVTTYSPAPSGAANSSGLPSGEGVRYGPQGNAENATPKGRAE